MALIGCHAMVRRQEYLKLHTMQFQGLALGPRGAQSLLLAHCCHCLRRQSSQP